MKIYYKALESYDLEGSCVCSITNTISGEINVLEKNLIKIIGMKLSELIAKAQEIYKEHGDLKVGQLMQQPSNLSMHAEFPKMLIEYVDEDEYYEGKPFCNIWIDDEIH